MRRIKSLLIGGLATASLVVAGTVAATAADPKGTLAIVNGVPGKKVDVCLNGKELRSGLGYGDKVQKPTVATGSKTIRFYSKDPRTCGGKLLGKKQFTLPPAADLTIVVTKKTPDKVLVFDNALLGEIPPLGAPTPFAPFAIRNAADLPADLAYRYWSNPPNNVPINPSGVFTKGEENRVTNASSGFTVGIAVQLRATIGVNPEAVASPIVEAIQSHRYEWILVGTKHANARWVVMDRVVSLPSP